MRSFVISVAALAILIGAYAVFINNAADSIHYMTDTISNEIISDVDSEDWIKAEEKISQISASWYQSRKAFSIFFNAESISEIETSLVMAKAYIRAGEKASSMAELSGLREKLFLLLENEMVSIENIM